MPPSTNNINQYDVRIDENISSKDVIFGVYNYSNETIFVPPYLPGIAEGQNYGDGPEQGPRYAIVLGYTHVFTPSLTNEFHAGFLHSIERLSGAIWQYAWDSRRIWNSGCAADSGKRRSAAHRYQLPYGHGSSWLDAHSFYRPHAGDYGQCDQNLRVTHLQNRNTGG